MRTTASKGAMVPNGAVMAEKFKDPVCGMMVEPAKAAASGTYGGQTVYFCSVGCKTAYERTHGRPS
jgi:YHS domain-containing protein